MFNIVNRDTRKPVENPVTRVLLEGNIVGLANHTVLISRDGKEIPINDSAAPIKDDHGNILGVILVFSDITEREKAEAALRKSEERLQMALNAANLAMWDWHVPSGEVIWNDMHYRMLGYKPGEVKPSYQAWRSRVYTEDIETAEALHQKSMDRGGDFSADYRLKWPDGTVHWVEVHGRFEHDSSGRALRSYGIMMDITERKHAEEGLRKLAEDLKRSNDDLQQFAYIASHDLQSPLRNVEGFVQLLFRRYKNKLDDKADEYITFIHDGVKDMQMLIYDLLEFSKVESEIKTFTSVDMSLCVNKAISNLKAEIDEKNAEIIQNETLPIVYGDAIQLRSLLQNLIGNAIKFSREQPKVHISCEERRKLGSLCDPGQWDRDGYKRYRQNIRRLSPSPQQERISQGQA